MIISIILVVFFIFLAYLYNEIISIRSFCFGILFQTRQQKCGLRLFNFVHPIFTPAGSIFCGFFVAVVAGGGAVVGFVLQIELKLQHETGTMRPSYESTQSHLNLRGPLANVCSRFHLVAQILNYAYVMWADSWTGRGGDLWGYAYLD